MAQLGEPQMTDVSVSGTTSARQGEADFGAATVLAVAREDVVLLTAHHLVNDRQAQPRAWFGTDIDGSLDAVEDPLELTKAHGVPTDSVVNFDHIHTIGREGVPPRVTTLSAGRMAEACRLLQAATGC